MRKFRILLLVLIFPFAAKIGRYGAVALAAMDGVWCNYTLPESDREFRQATDKLTGLHTPLGTPQPGDWRASQIEPAQTFAQFALSNPTRMTDDRKTIYVQPVGTFSASQRTIVDLCAEFLGCYFCCDVEVLPDLDENIVGPEARRIHPVTKETQFLAPWIHDIYLKPRLPDDAAVLLALTATDLWPGEDWNFVFGQASLKDRVGVWSMARFGDPDESSEAFRTCLKRTLKIASHETGHMFSMHHCVMFQCNMTAGGSIEECDRYPLYLCPECEAKLLWSIRPNPVERFRRLADFCERNHLTEEFDYYTNAARFMETTPLKSGVTRQ